MCPFGVVGTGPSGLHSLCWHNGLYSHKSSSAHYHLLLQNPVTAELLLLRKWAVLSTIRASQSSGVQSMMCGIVCLTAHTAAAYFSSSLHHQDVAGDLAFDVEHVSEDLSLPTDKHFPP